MRDLDIHLCTYVCGGESLWLCVGSWKKYNILYGIIGQGGAIWRNWRKKIV